MNNKDFKHELLVWADNVIKAQKQFDESDRCRADIWYRPDLMIEAVTEILNKGFEK